MLAVTGPESATGRFVATLTSLPLSVLESENVSHILPVWFL